MSDQEQEPIHRTLRRQLQRAGIAAGQLPTAEQFEDFCARINRSFYHTDETRYTLERSLDLSSKEMRELNESLAAKGQELLLLEQSKLATVIESIDTGICAFNKAGKVVTINSTAKAILGFAPSSGREIIQNLEIYDLEGKKTSDNLAAIKTLFREHKAAQEYNGYYIQNSGNKIRISLSVTPLRDSNNNPHGLVMSIKDMTSQHHAMAELAEELKKSNEAVEAKNTFLATMSHELRTPLNAVLGMVELLQTTNLDEEQAELAKIAKTSGDLLLDIINNVLEVTKLEKQRIFIELSEFNVNVLAQELVSSLIPMAAETGNKISIDGKVPNDQLLLGSPNRIKQVILNLLSNALKFTHQGDVTLAIEAKQLADPEQLLVIFTVTDNGLGIAEDDLKKLFVPFTQIENKLTNQFTGSGLGLAISKKLVEQMNGNITVESILGEGTTFQVELPLKVVADADNNSPNMLIKSSSSLK